MSPKKRTPKKRYPPEKGTPKKGTPPKKDNENEIQRVAELEAESIIETSKIYSTDDSFKEEIKVSKNFF